VTGEDLNIFKKFNFERKPVAVKFSTTKPEKVEKLDKVMDFCEMLVEAQSGRSFYVTVDNFTCIGPILLGMKQDASFETGMVGPKLGVYKSARANRRIYDILPKLPPNIINYVAFSPLDQPGFDPDLLIITATVSQADVLVRARSYNTGKGWDFKGTPVAACAWLYIYPYKSGEMNISVTGLSLGMKARQLFPEGLILMSIPWDLLPEITANLKEMQWVLPSHTLGREGHKKRLKAVMNEIKQEMEKK
jgi:uncharacterized protein (DUF169 family)